MPRYLKEDGSRVPNVRVEKAWFIIPVKADKVQTTKHSETYLIPTRVADYIEKLEKCIKGELPKLNSK